MTPPTPTHPTHPASAEPIPSRPIPSDGTAAARVRDFFSLAKPRVVALVALTAAVGAGLAMTHTAADPLAVILALAGITLVASSAAAFNCLVESQIDAAMNRTRRRPLPGGRVTPMQAAIFSAVLGAAGIAMVATWGGTVAAWLSLATFFGYAVVYTLCLKRATPQNIVIGGISGAMPPVLGWCAAAGELTYEPLLLCLIIFIWTPPHFWSLAMTRADDYARAGLPMLPVTHGAKFTAAHISLYALMLLAASALPYVSGMAGEIYLAAALVLGARFLFLAEKLRRTLADADARRVFSFSVAYLAALFGAMLADRLALA